MCHVYMVYSNLNVQQFIYKSSTLQHNLKKTTCFIVVVGIEHLGE